MFREILHFLTAGAVAYGVLASAQGCATANYVSQKVVSDPVPCKVEACSNTGHADVDYKSAWDDSLNKFKICMCANGDATKNYDAMMKKTNEDGTSIKIEPKASLESVSQR